MTGRKNKIKKVAGIFLHVNGVFLEENKKKCFY